MNIFLVSDEERPAVMDMLPEDVAEEEPVLLCAAEEVEGELRTVGILSATMDGNSWYITHIAVEKDMRRQGIGRALVSGLIDMARGSLADGICLEYCLDPNADPVADAFFDALKFTEVQRSNIYSIPVLYIGSRLQNLLADIPEGNYTCLKDIPGRLWAQLRQDLTALGEDYTPSPKTPLKKQMLYIDPGDRRLYDGDISSVFLAKNGRVGGCILMSERKQGISVDYVCTLLDDTLEYSGALTGIFWLSYQQILEKYGDNVRLFANTQNDMSERLFLKFAAGKKEVYGVSVEREMAL